MTKIILKTASNFVRNAIQLSLITTPTDVITQYCYDNIYLWQKRAIYVCHNIFLTHF